MGLLVLDIATSPVPNLTDLIEDSDVAAPDHYKDPVKIADYIEKARSKFAMTGALDFDLARVTAIGTLDPALGPEPAIALLTTEAEERSCIEALADRIEGPDLTLVTFNGLAFDLPMLMRRARYLGIAFPRIQLEHWKSPHIDVCLALRFERPQLFKSHSLSF